MSFETSRLVRFADVDSAGIVFYPRYFEMLNGAVEDWFAAMGESFRHMQLVRRRGVPTVHVECDFHNPSFMEDVLTIAITPRKLGRSSCTIDYAVTCGGEMRLTASGVLVFNDLDTGRGAPWPDEIARQIGAALVA